MVPSGEGFHFVYFQETHGELTGFNWDLTYSAFVPSWGSEVNIMLHHIQSGFTFTFDGSDGNFAETPGSGADVTFGWGNSSGLFSSAGAVNVTGIDDTFGDWEVWVFDDLVDFPGNNDGFFLTGSIIEIKKIPAPGALALLGIAGLIGRRRRR